MGPAELKFEIKEIPVPDGGLRLELFVEGRRIGAGNANADVLEAMQAALGIGRDQVRSDMEEALKDYLKHQLEKVQVRDIREEPGRPLRYQARYIYQEFEEVRQGLVWYDVNTGETGESDVPVIARNRLRHEIHRMLTENSPITQGILDPNR